jgi:hypothetical protein
LGVFVGNFLLCPDPLDAYHPNNWQLDKEIPERVVRDGQGGPMRPAERVRTGARL